MNETNVTPDQDNTAFANQKTPEAYRFAPLVAYRSSIASRPARARLLSSSFPKYFPSRFGILLHPLFHRLAPLRLVLGWSRSLVGIDTENSDVIQQTPHPLFCLPLYAARSPHQFSKYHTLQQLRVTNCRGLIWFYLSVIYGRWMLLSA